MADLTGTTPANTYKGLLQVNDYTDGIAGNTGSNALVIQDGAGNATALAISTDNVGIGTTSPARLLHLKNSNSAIAFETPIDANGSAFAQIKSGRDGNSGYSSTIEFTTTESTTAVPTFGNNGSGGSGFVTRMIINSAGNVGIGTTSPDRTLHIVDATNDGSGGLKIQNYKPVIELSDSTALATATTLTQDDTKFTIANDSVDALTIDSNGNVGIGTTSFGATAAGVLAIKNGTAPTSSPADMVQLYAEDVTASSELRVRDEAGNVTTLSPHAKDAPDSLYDQGKGVDEMHRVANHYLGTITFTNVDRRNDLLQKQLNGEELPVDRTFKVTETFAEYNTRTGADLQVEDWDANQQAMFDEQEEKVVARQAEIDAWDNEEEEAPAPLESYVKKPKPEWLS